MKLNIGKEVAALKRMTVNELRAKYAEEFGEVTGARHKEWLMRRIAWRLQARAEGDISERARQRAAELAANTDIRTTCPRVPKPVVASPVVTRTATLLMSNDDRLPLPGTILLREYKGQTLEVRVLPRGFEFEGEVYRSLSAVAKKITGTHCNGYYFFRLGKLGAAK